MDSSGIFLISICCGGVLSGQEIKRPESYNYLRGLEALQNEDVAGALDFFEKDVQDNPKNSYSYSWLAYLWYKTEEYGRALTAANKAVKFIPKKDGEYLYWNGKVEREWLFVKKMQIV